jgi:Zn-dependent M28 family amino/carboxypeptidase
LIPGQGSRAHETLIVGAHRDHFGRQGGLFFPGADDNASGTAILLEVARVLSQSESRPSRSILFASFSGEEQGLLGSRLYVNDPPRPLSSTVAMINVDHAGIGNGRLTVGVVGVNGLPKEAAAEAGRLAGLVDQLDLYGYFPGGDHVPFKESGVSTIAIVSAGRHPHFHQPSDHVKTLKPEVLEAVTRYLLALLWVLAYTP